MEAMGGESPYHITVRWGSIGNVVRWYAQHKATLADYLSENDEEFGKQTMWWLQIFLVNAHFKIVCKIMKEIQGKAVLVSEQSLAIQDLFADLLELYNIDLTENYATTENEDPSNPGAVSLGDHEAILGVHKVK